MAIDGYFISGYWCYYISGYSTNGYCWLFHCKPLVVILLVVLHGYGWLFYWWLFY
jgi:hypothetical protein